MTIPTTWRSTTLGEQLTFQRGFDITRKQQQEGPYPVVSSSGPNSTHDRFMVEGPGIVIGRKVTLGTVFLVPSNFWPHDTTLWVKDFHGNDPCFAYYFLKMMGFEQFDCGASNPTLNRNHIHGLPILYPILPVQRKIASVLSAYDDLIENNTRRIAILEEMAQALYREWFVRFRFPGHVNVPLVPSPLGAIPQGWWIATLDEVAQEIIDYRGKTPKKLGGDWSEEGTIALSALNIKNGHLVNLEKAKRVDDGLYAKWMKSELEHGDILMTSEAPLGEMHYLNSGAKYCLSQRVFAIRADQAVLQPTLLYFALSSEVGQKQLYSRATGTTVLGIRQSQLRTVPLVIPDARLQRLAHATLDAFLQDVHTLSRANETLRKTRDLLLPRLISGQLDVEHLDIEASEPLAV